ncbi:MAG: aminotransferase class I/II-fold pyridoxal phosphate-dependent enzyme, partial [Mogibacterium sp.]|nr:aminotransferase class I/II-fold pyridoxal phosphate-dependent enzyme [Mogibacterium sp.]
MKDRVSLTDFLMYHKETHPISFHMPGHKGRGTLYGIYGFGDFIKNVVGNDITEIPGADALQQPRERIKDIMEGYAGLYGAKHTELLVNGSSAGLMASILGSVPRGGKLLMGRNSHRSVYGALRLGGVDPVYIMPEIDDETGLQLGLDPDKIEAALIEDPDIKAVLVTSPNYYGVLSDIERIASIVHLHGRILIVDQAHGAHLKFFDYLRSEDGLPHRAAENCGADIVVDSTHKTLLSFTGSAILNICTERPDVSRISELLRMLQTTSPSYLLMGSLDINQQILRMDGYNLIKNWDADIKYFYQEAAQIAGLGLIDRIDLDETKVSITMSALGLSGPKLAEELEKRNIWVELTHGDYVM